MIFESIIGISLWDQVNTSLFFLRTHPIFHVHPMAMMYLHKRSYEAHPYIGPRNISILLVHMWECFPSRCQVLGHA